MKIMKKAVALMLVAVLVSAVFVGCAKDKNVTVDSKEVVMVVGDTEVTMNMANFFVRYNQSMLESMYTSYVGENVWITEMSEGVTYGESLKETLLQELQNLYVVTSRVADYNITLTDEDMQAIESAADAFIAENSDKDVLDKVSADRDTVVEYLKLYTLSEKMAKAMKAEADPNVTDDEAAQKRMRYIEILKKEQLQDGSTKELSEDEIADAKKEIETFLKGAKANGSMEAYATENEIETKTLAFDAESTALDEEVIKAADKLNVNEFSKVIETETGIYAVQLESEFDAEATESQKEVIVAERQEAKYQELVEKWTKETEIVVHEKVWKKISLHDLKVNYIEDKTEE